MWAQGDLWNCRRPLTMSLKDSCVFHRGIMLTKAFRSVNNQWKWCLHSQHKFEHVVKLVLDSTKILFVTFDNGAVCLQNSAMHVCLVLLAICVLQLVLGWFPSECWAAMMAVGSSKPEPRDPCWKSMDCSLWFKNELLPKAKELSIAGSCSQVTWDEPTSSNVGYYIHSFWWRASWAGRQSFLTYQSIYPPTVTYAHELWVVKEILRSLIQVA